MELPKRMLFLLLFLKIAKTIEGKTKLMKILFLAKNEYGIEHGYEFKKYIYGPYASEVSSDIKTLKDLELINVKETLFEAKGPFTGRLITLSLTNNGSELLKGRMKEFESDTIKKVDKILKEWNSKSLQEIISYVYGNYLS